MLEEEDEEEEEKCGYKWEHIRKSEQRGGRGGMGVGEKSRW